MIQFLKEPYDIPSSSYLSLEFFSFRSTYLDISSPNACLVTILAIDAHRRLVTWRFSICNSLPFLLCHTGAQIRQLVDFILGENRTIRKYLPKGLKKHNYPKLRKRIDEIGIFSNIEDNNLIEVSSTVESVEAIPQRGKPENPLTEKEWQDIEALRNKIDEQERLIDDFKKTL